jgi:hypothetical protein
MTSVGGPRSASMAIEVDGHRGTFAERGLTTLLPGGGQVSRKHFLRLLVQRQLALRRR